MNEWARIHSHLHLAFFCTSIPLLTNSLTRSPNNRKWYLFLVDASGGLLLQPLLDLVLVLSWRSLRQPLCVRTLYLTCETKSWDQTCFTQQKKVKSISSHFPIGDSRLWTSSEKQYWRPCSRHRTLGSVISVFTNTARRVTKKRKSCERCISWRGRVCDSCDSCLNLLPICSYSFSVWLFVVV